jgi:hypothetical protein
MPEIDSQPEMQRLLLKQLEQSERIYGIAVNLNTLFAKKEQNVKLQSELMDKLNELLDIAENIRETVQATAVEFVRVTQGG